MLADAWNLMSSESGPQEVPPILAGCGNPIDVKHDPVRSHEYSEPIDISGFNNQGGVLTFDVQQV